VSAELLEPVTAYLIVAVWGFLVTGAALWLRARTE
jgi:hypothetical protein